MKKEKAKEKEIKYRNKNQSSKLKKVFVILLLSMILILGIVYFILKIVHESGPFTITLDERLSRTSGVIMYEDLSRKVEKRILKSDSLEYLDNISINWIPQDIHKLPGGSNNGENYIAYTFYLENQGSDTTSYWYSTVIDDVIKNVDEAVRVRIYLNGESTIYAKINSQTGDVEPGTKMFYSDEFALVEQRKDMKPGAIDKFTIVIWIEGDDPDCLDNLIGGEIKMHMEITESNISDK